MDERDEVELTTSLTGLPSIYDLDKGNGKIFALIESGNHAGVEKFLAERGHKVNITPKIGCSPIHYSKLNLANCENENDDTPLIMAAKVDCKMVQIVIKYGGNPNHANKDRDTPLSIAANRSDRETIDVLLLAGGNLRAAVVKLTSALRYISEKQLKESTRAGFSVRPLTILLADDVYLKCRDPIKTAFDVCKDIEHIKDVRDEFKIEFELLMRDADLFAYKFLNHCDKMFEAREILTSSLNLLTTAIDRSKKKFVSHPFSQQIINERWYGETANRLLFGKTLITFKYLTSPLVLPLLFLKFLFIDICRGIPFMDSSFADLLRLLFVPCLCFTTDAINYIGFMAVMVSTCLIPFGAGTYKVTAIEYVLYYCVFARILIETDLLIQQTWKRYFRNFWNFVDLSVILLLVVAAIYKGSINYIISRQQNIIEASNYNSREFNITWYAGQEDILINQHDNSMNVNFIYAVAEFILTIRLLSLLEIHKSLGTMLIALKYLAADVIKFGVILLTIILGTSVAIFSMTIALQEWNQELETIAVLYDWPEGLPKKLPDVTDERNRIEIPDVFATFSDTLRNILWGTFGLLDVVNLKIEKEQPTTDFINIMMILYVLLSCVLLLNMLIGILSSTFDMVKQNCDIEWKYARSTLLKEYSRAQPFLFPFFPFLFPFIIWFRRKLRQEQTKNRQKDSNLTEENERDKLIEAVCDRFMFGNLVGGSDGDGDMEDQSFETRMKFRKQKSVLLQIAQKVKSKSKTQK